MAEKTCFIYTTVQSAADAKSFAEELIKSRTVACVNVFPDVQSCYSLEGNVTWSCETGLFLKTFESRLKEALHLVRDLHPYEIPCIATIPLDDMDLNYVEWMKKWIAP